MKKRRDNEYHTTAMKTMKLWMMAAILTAAVAKIKIKAEVQFPGTHAPTPAELEIESIPYNLPMCFDAKETLQARNTHNSQTTQQSSTLSDAEKAKMLQEVEAQQADFGLQK